MTGLKIRRSGLGSVQIPTAAVILTVDNVLSHAVQASAAQ